MREISYWLKGVVFLAVLTVAVISGCSSSENAFFAMDPGEVNDAEFACLTSENCPGDMKCVYYDTTYRNHKAAETINYSLPMARPNGAMLYMHTGTCYAASSQIFSYDKQSLTQDGGYIVNPVNAKACVDSNGNILRDKTCVWLPSGMPVTEDSLDRLTNANTAYRSWKWERTYGEPCGWIHPYAITDDGFIFNSEHIPFSYDAFGDPWRYKPPVATFDATSPQLGGICLSLYHLSQGLTSLSNLVVEDVKGNCVHVGEGDTMYDICHDASSIEASDDECMVTFAVPSYERKEITLGAVQDPNGTQVTMSMGAVKRACLYLYKNELTIKDEHGDEAGKGTFPTLFGGDWPEPDTDPAKDATTLSVTPQMERWRYFVFALCHDDSDCEGVTYDATTGVHDVADDYIQKTQEDVWTRVFEPDEAHYYKFFDLDYLNEKTSNPLGEKVYTSMFKGRLRCVKGLTSRKKIRDKGSMLLEVPIGAFSPWIRPKEWDIGICL